ncbi:hypothetical protein [Shewanella xiamenensis]|uniref:Uncharacterized protein n=1 Tax=Shewanella xiamenensis TaxID=332186 RepID=A0AAE4PWJ3_9GAMM|nr:hypothetical protein [Shewanella xiamenensis]MDV5389174.1 hypothetical protein [Shewanella xiamenensis]
MSNKNNPIQAVKITQRDFRETPPPKSGPKPLREVTKELVDKLQSDIDKSTLELKQHFQSHPNVPAVLKVQGGIILC